MGNGGWKSRVERRLWGGGRRENGAEAELCPSAPKFGILVEIIIIIIRGKKKTKQLFIYFFSFAFFRSFRSSPGVLWTPRRDVSAEQNPLIENGKRERSDWKRGEIRADVRNRPRVGVG